MPKRHRKFSIAIIIIATLSLPLFSDASLGEKGLVVGQNIGLFLSSLGSTLDQSVDAAENVARSMYDAASAAWQAGSHHISQGHSIVKQASQHLMSQGHQMLRSLPEQISNKISNTKAQIKTTAQQAFSSLPSRLPSPISYLSSLSSVKQGFLALRTGGETLDGKEEAKSHETGQADRKTSNGGEPAIREQLSSPLHIIERILVKEVENKPITTSQLATSPLVARGYSQDPRINSLITNVADLTSRLDEKDGSPYRNSALFAMISQSQRIKTLDDVKITNATIEGYVTGTTLSTYLPLGGGHTHRRINRNHTNPLRSLHPVRSKPLGNS